ncbi:hypothetical protein [Catenuloplanes indicus]|uniref:Uncharacterized protein n=1 Tax=Catenuloplanes indicus TaxID=137267 RepID=A0AAE3W870_9ACTN|nr:hypothetical protein [Catenuloplanes indicus]MDQ0371261.1 hypothetical protein [Catenuloplanes indicus]
MAAEVQVGADRTVVFWCDPATAGRDQLAGLRATDATGAELPTGTYTPSNG